MKEKHDYTYFQMVNDILEEGTVKESRAGKVISTFGKQYVYPLNDGLSFPLLTTKKMELKNVYHELCWFLRGDTNVNSLKAPQLWLPWAKEDGSLGPIYGSQWRFWKRFDLFKAGRRQACAELDPIDQITQLIEGLRKDPFGRRHIVSAWNVQDIPKMALPPCHCFFQCYVEEVEGVKYLDLQMYQRSADTAIGVPYNIASYSLLLLMLARATGYKARNFVHTLGDMHIYTNHTVKLVYQMDRKVKESPAVSINTEKTFWELVQDDDFSDIKLDNYDPDKFIKFEVAV